MKVNFKNYITPLLSLLLLTYCTSKEEPLELSISDRIAAERSSDLEMERKIDDLIASMSFEEKVGQMTQLNEAFFDIKNSNDDATGTQSNVIDSLKAAQTLEKYQIGSFLTGGTRDAEKWVEIIKQLQQINMKVSISKIPFIFAVDQVHGSNYLNNGTIFPHGINIGASFNPQFAYDMGSVTTREIAHIGHHWNFAPILGIGRQKLWPRLYETFGEDTHLSSIMGASYIKGQQETMVGPYKVAACAKHYIGYSVPEQGWDRTPAEIAPQTLQEVFIPSFQKAIDENVLTVMINSGDVNGEPVHASYHFLTKLLRDQQGFKGVAITDYRDIIKLHTEHFITENEKESTYLSIMAGIDMSMTPKTTDFCDHLIELVEEGRITEERLDLSVRRILRVKFQIGLFDNPYPTNEYIDLIGSEDHHSKAREATEESLVLMKNENDLLPLSRSQKILLAGPNADLKKVLAGGWTYSWQGDDESKYPENMPTLLDGLKKEFGDGNVTLSNAKSLISDAKNAEIIVLALGETPYAEGIGNIDDFDLPKEQLDLIDIAKSTGKPIVAVLIEGRPRTLGEYYDKLDASIFAGLPGNQGALAIAGVLSGRVNPSGKMSITYPFKSGHMIPYNFKHMTFSDQNIRLKELARYAISEFGEGLSYSSFSYSDLTLSKKSIRKEESLVASVTVTNNSDIDGKEAALWFISDEIASISRPVRQLKHFSKKLIKAGESETFKFEINPKEHLSFPNEKGALLLENGWFKLSVGGLEKRFELK